MAIKPKRAKILFGLATRGRRREFWKSFETSPLASAHGFDFNYKGAVELLELHDDSEGVGDAGGGGLGHGLPSAGSRDTPAPAPPGQAVRDSNRQMQKDRSSRKNTLDFSTFVFADVYKFRRLDACNLLNTDAYDKFKGYLRTAYTKTGRQTFLIDMSYGALTDILTKTAARLQSPEFAAELHFEYLPKPTDERLIQDSNVAGVAFRTFVALAFQFILWESQYTCALPGAMYKIIDPEKPARIPKQEVYIPLLCGGYSLISWRG